MREQINNKKILEPYRKTLRKNLTPAEAFLWRLLKNNQLENRKFRRQHSIGNYILDFYCPSEKLAIELDGASHFTPEGIEYDTIRTEYINSFNIKVVRFENKLVFDNTTWVLDEIKSNFRTVADCGEIRTTTPSCGHPSLPGGERLTGVE
jgi:very-short-patch-repair endonuclease